MISTFVSKNDFVLGCLMKIIWLLKIDTTLVYGVLFYMSTRKQNLYSVSFQLVIKIRTNNLQLYEDGTQFS